MKALLLLPAFFLAACGSLPQKADPPTVTTGRTVLIDRKFYEECSPPPRLLGGNEDVVVAWATELLSSYENCLRRNAAHIQFLRKNFPEAKVTQ